MKMLSDVERCPHRMRNGTRCVRPTHGDEPHCDGGCDWAAHVEERNRLGIVGQAWEEALIQEKTL